MSVSDAVRKQIISMCESSKSRRVAIEFPCQWTPGEVINPETGSMRLGFSSSGAWFYLAELVKNGCHIDEIELTDVPKGKKAFVILSPMPCGRYLYIKIMFGNGMILGRSFHYSEHTFGSELVN